VVTIYDPACMTLCHTYCALKAKPDPWHRVNDSRWIWWNGILTFRYSDFRYSDVDSQLRCPPVLVFLGTFLFFQERFTLKTLQIFQEQGRVIVNIGMHGGKNLFHCP
jgi:hypothetical protein